MQLIAPDVDTAAHASRRRASGVAMLVGASILWSLAGVAVKTLQLPTITFTVYRSLGAVAALALAVPLFRGHRPRAGWMTASALLYTAVVTLFIIATNLSTAAAGILFQYTSPVWCALLAWFVQCRPLGRRTGAALLIATAGVAVMIAGQPAGRGWAGPACGIASGLAFGALILVLEKLDAPDEGGGVNPALIVLFNNLGVVCVLPLLAYASHLPVHAGVPAWKLAAVAGVGIVQLAIPYLMLQFALRRVTPVDASLLTLLEPVLNPLWVALVTPERPDAATYIGGAAILVSLLLEATKKPERAE